MMYFSSSYISVKRNQDYSDFSSFNDHQILVLCDGIGEFDQSGEIAKKVVDSIFSNQYLSISELIEDNKLQEYRSSNVKAGTTILLAKNKSEANEVDIQYLGNGGIISLAGDFELNPTTHTPYRYVEIMLPHISPKGELTRHFSHNSGPPELDYSEIQIKLNHPCGNILLFFTDGIATLEEKFIIADEKNRYWRSESALIQFILEEMHRFLLNLTKQDFQERLSLFNREVLHKLKVNHFLEDDASLGIIITDTVLDYYKSKND